jgi:predicted DNA-binding transcriptional regulator YafY
VRGDQLARQWQLIQRLAKSRAGCGLDELADELGCVRRTVYRDLDALMYAGFPVVSEKRDGRSLYRFLDTFSLGDVPFTPDEILALAFSEDLLRILEGTVFHDSIASALQKIRAGLSPELVEYLARLGESFRVLPGPHKRYAHLRDTIQALHDAVLRRRTVRMRYRTGRTGTVANRDLDPYRVWYRSGGLYVVGLDHKSGEIRTFAIDRIQRLATTDATFAVQDGFDFDVYVGSSFGVITEPATRVRIRFDARWATYVEEHIWHPSQTLARGRDGALELTMEVGGTSELRQWIQSFGSGAEVLEPEALREEVVKDLRASLARYAPEPAEAGRSRKRARKGRTARSGAVAVIVAALLWLAAPAEAGYPDWEAAADVPVIEIITHDEDGGVRESKVWFVLVDGEPYLRTNDSRWLANLRRDPACQLRIEGAEYEASAEEIPGEAIIERVDAASLEKYGWQERLIHPFRLRKPEILRLTPTP